MLNNCSEYFPVLFCVRDSLLSRDFRAQYFVAANQPLLIITDHN